MCTCGTNHVGDGNIVIISIKVLNIFSDGLICMKLLYYNISKKIHFRKYFSFIISIEFCLPALHNCNSIFKSR